MVSWRKAVLCFCLWAFYGAGSPVQASMGQEAFETILANGLKVILLENHKAPVITFQVWYRVGSRNETWGKTGLSHMLEHMMFKGTEKVGPEDLSRIVQEHGGNDNAFTSQDYTAYFENLSSEHAPLAIELESDRMRNLVLREQDFRTERMVVMEERRLRSEDNPFGYLLEQVGAAAFQTSPYHWPTIGWMQDIQRLTLADVRAHYRTYYNPANAFLVVVGDFSRETLSPRIAEAFGAYPKGSLPDPARDVDPPQTGERRIVVRKEARLPMVVMAYHVPNLRDPDSYVLEVMAALLSRGKSSRFYRALVREKRLALDVDAAHSLLSRDPELFTIAATVLPGKDIGTVEQALDAELQRLQEELVSEHELEKAKHQLEADFIMGQDSIFYQAMLLAQYEVASGWRNIDDYLPAVRKVSSEDIRRVARRYLVPGNRTVGILKPLPAKKPAPQAGAAAPNYPIR